MSGAHGRCFALYGGTPVAWIGPDAQETHGIGERVGLDSVQDTRRTMARWRGVEEGWAALEDAATR